MRYSIFWDVTQPRLVDTDVSGQRVGECLVPENGTDSLNRNVCQLTTI